MWFTPTCYLLRLRICGHKTGGFCEGRGTAGGTATWDWPPAAHALLDDFPDILCDGFISLRTDLPLIYRTELGIAAYATSSAGGLKHVSRGEICSHVPMRFAAWRRFPAEGGVERKRRYGPRLERMPQVASFSASSGESYLLRPAAGWRKSPQNR